MNRLVLLPAAAAVLAAGSAQAQQRTIVPGQLTRGTLSTSDPRLTDDTFYDEYVFSGRRGETVVVSMESGTFDSFLHLGVLRYGQWQSLSTDDDGGGGTNSRIQLQLPEDGTYAIRANSLSRDVGEYTLSLVGGRAGSAGSGKEGVVGMYDAAPTQPYGGGRGGRFLEPGRRIDAYLSSSDPVLDGREPF
ncbi:MAG TPA: PPC domain-containing protein, partial [Longimicrobium sp.]|nr:PPC domain-containing protein [Longimicrobium sp.]